MLHEADWMVVLNTYHPNFAYDLLLKQFLKIYDQCFPFKTIQINSKSPWITKGLLKSSKKETKVIHEIFKT